MAYVCPRCGDKVGRGYSSTAQWTAGLVGLLFYAAFGPLECKRCGRIPFSEFPSDVQMKIALTSAAMVVGALAIIGLVVWLISLK